MEYNSQLICALQMIQSEDKNNRNKAENFFESIESNNHYLSNLINISIDMKFPIDLRLTASILVKNYVKNFWANGEIVMATNLVDKLEKEKVKNIVIPSEEKLYIQNNIFNIVLNSNNNHIIKMYLNVIKRILKYNFLKWEKEFMEKIENWLTSGDQIKILYGLKIFSKLAKEYEFCHQEMEIYIRNFVRIKSFLEGIIENIICIVELNDILNTIVYYILKIYQCTIRLSIPQVLNDENTLLKWFSYFTLFINKIENLTYNESNKLWKNIILSFKISSFIYSQYGKTIRNKKNSDLSNLIKNKISNPLSNVYIKALFTSSKQDFPSEIICILYSFFAKSIKRKENIEIIQNSLNFIFNNLLLKYCRITEEDFELRVSNPKYYIYNQYNSIELGNEMRYCIAEFVRLSMKLQDIKNLTLFNYVMEILYQLLKQADEKNDFFSKEVILYLFEYNYHEISGFSDEFINELVASYIYKDLDSECGLLRERACSFLSVIEPNKIKNIDLIKCILEKFIPRLEDHELPIKIKAALAIPQLIIREEIKSYFKQYISNILSIYLKLIEVIELDKLVICLEQIVSNFDTDIMDFCYDLMVQMVGSCMNLIKVENEEDNHEAEVTASCCLRAIRKLLSLSSKNPYLYEKVEKCLEPILTLFLCNEPEKSCLDDYEPLITLINDIVVFSPSLSQFSWCLYTPLIFSMIGTEEEIKFIFTTNNNCNYYQKIGFEYMDKICFILMNYIIRDPNTFVNSCDSYNNNYLNQTMNLVNNLVKISSSKKTEFEACNAIKIINVMLETLQGKIDSIFQILLFFLIEQLKASRTEYYKIKIISAIANCFIYNPLTTLKTLDSISVTENIFQVWIFFLPKVYNMKDIKRFMMGFTSILSTYNDDSGQFIKNNVFNIFKEIIVLLKKLLDLNQNQHKIKELETEENQEYEEEVNGNSNLIDINYNEDDDEDEDYEETSNEILSTSLDSRCEFKYFIDFLNFIYQKDLNLYNKIMSSINNNENQIIQLIISKVNDDEKKNK